jgi:putative FmdB family regulatory protein
MPFYEFKCPDCFRLEEKYFAFTEEHKLMCESCKKIEMQKVIQATPAIFTGGGWGGM